MSSPTHDCAEIGSVLFDAWHPGVESAIPKVFRHLETLVQPDASASSAEALADFADLTGLPPEEISDFLPGRLALHAVIVRVTADLAVPEGDSEEQFGRNFRRLATTLFEEGVRPRQQALEDWWVELRHSLAETVRSCLHAAIAPQPAPPVPWWRRLLDRQDRPTHDRGRETDDATLLANIRQQGLQADDPLTRAVYRSLYRVLGALHLRRGHVGRDTALLERLAVDHLANSYGAERLGEWLAPHIDAVIADRGLRRVPNADHPLLVSLKGASAAGKSSLRPMLKQLMRDQGIAPDDYATISPDVWRRLLLDYDALGPAYKYAGHLTSREIMVIDGKLDRYIRRKADKTGAIPHLLVDRFRFDSFESERITRVLHETYARYVDTLDMYFLVTPPEETVVRGWQRALERGRYKAVEDFLGHSIEAYTGMPRILFKWLASPTPKFRYTFLDNRVPKGTFPKTIAIGTRERIGIYDPLAMIDITRYQKINVHATSAGEVYPSGTDLAAARNLGFLRECLARVPEVEFATQPGDAAYALYRSGRFQILDDQRWQAVLANPEAADLFSSLGLA